jgi:hypothetical protein
MEIVEFTQIMSNSDTMEGKGHTIVHGYTRNAEIARAIVSDKRFARYCVMGVQSPDDYKYMTKSVTIKIFESVDDFFHNSKEEIRKRALAKLSAAEREALGV